MDSMFDNLSNHLSIIRNKATTEIINTLLASQKNDSDFNEKYDRSFQKAFSLIEDEKWEGRSQGFIFSKALLYSFQNLPLSFTDSYRKKLLSLTSAHLFDPESHVRIALSEMIEILSKMEGISIYHSFKDPLFSNIRSILSNRKDNESTTQDLSKLNIDTCQPSTTLDGIHLPKIAAKGIRHDTEGWKTLETSLSILRRIIIGCGPLFTPYVDMELLDLVFDVQSCVNRFVREVSVSNPDLIDKFLNRIYNNSGGINIRITNCDIGIGLSDNWSQVRLAASVAAREFLLKEKNRSLLPRMCLNRYYLAPGVNKYSQESWLMVTERKGKELVSQYIDSFVPYFIEQSKAENHAVREAACHCIAEICMKVNHTTVASYVAILLGALIESFKDPSWPVRDSACNACGNIVLEFPIESKEKIDELYTLWFKHLAENIPCIRENSAIALGKCIKAYGNEALNKILTVLREELPKAKSQPTETTKYSGESSSNVIFGVSHKKLRDNDPSLHTGQETYTCGSMRASKQDTGEKVPSLVHGQATLVRNKDSDSGFIRDHEPWEHSDGGIYLLRELSFIHKECVSEFIPLICDIGRISSFSYHWHLKETIWKQMPVIAQNIGKREFKSFLEFDILPSLFIALKSDNRLAANAAGEALDRFGKFIGPTILSGRLTPEQLDICASSPFVLPPFGTGSTASFVTENNATNPLFQASMDFCGDLKYID